MPAALRAGCLRGRLPDPDFMTVGALGNVAVNEASRAECERDRADRAISLFDTAVAEWRAAQGGDDGE